MSQTNKNSINVLADLLLQPYALDPGSLEYLIEESTSSGQDGPLKVVCYLLRNRQLGEMDRENLAEFIRRAERSSPTLRRAFRHSLKKKGRCPKLERSWLRRQLESGEVEVSVTSSITPRSTGSAYLDLREISGSIAQFPRILDRIGHLDPLAGQLRVALGDFTYAAALAVIAEWILAQKMVTRYEFVDCSPNVERYLENIGFSTALRNPEIIISPDPMDWAVGLTRINQNQPTEKVTDKIVDILHTFANPSLEDRQALRVLISEMIENVHRHAETPTDGFAVAQVYPRKLKMGITLVDAGIGVRESFERGDPSVPIDNLQTDQDFLTEACKLHSTSKRVPHSGYGLYLLAELIARNRGTFLLTSGTATLMGYQKGNKVEFDAYPHQSWQGTIISVIIDLSRALPLLQLYKEMPAVPGYEDDDDLFVD